ncbi:O-succinylbenzoic acid--CoA ligase [[Actinomadura] parvosata subsp. kistnae]|uniref:Acyl-CoA synthetase n=1 Tax=[Actinomadura] parvosata subsp. kistnae TaxID=1909395 RepID=A0A1U9ZQF0_9ACTN|nr:AMP-binding protein [Nonomuraea sp. ATCC 55076]AQZ60167.1 acyl-CoA synthetase [Nonomuraea sp. ATCC 55076]SPL91364.1 O-succinylbenzoic acid--CoA ligase [Actinomadura parvosata subsp. kistnae]
MDVSELPGFYAIAAADPGRLAVIDTDDTRVTYGDLLARVNQVSHGLRARGLVTGDVVAGVLPNGVDALVMVMATGQIGLYYVPINWHLTDAEIAYILGDCDAKVVVTGPDQAVPGAEVGTDGLAEGQPTGAPGGRTAGAVMWYTSGTTGFPKGVQRRLPGAEPEAIVPLYTWFVGEVVDLKPGDDVHLVTSPMYHSAPCAHAQFALHLGHTVVITPRFDPVHILELIERHRVSNAMMVPTMFHRMLQLPPDVRDKYDVSSLRQVIHTAAACPVAVKRQIMEWWGPVLYEYYGSTESTIAFSVKPHDWLARPGTVGRPAPTFEARILDDAGQELPPGEPGMIYVKSSMGSFEYRKDPAKTAASKRGEWYAPGDIGYLDEDGYLFLCDRRTDLIVSGGVNIYPAEIEAALLEHPAVADVAVIGVPDEEWGHNVVALVQPADGVEPGPQLTAELMEHCGPRIARFKQPKVIEYRAALPRTPTGKLSRSKVRADYLAGNTSSSL